MPKKDYKGIGGGLYKDTRGKRKNQKFSIGTSGARVYRDGGKKVVVRPKAKKKKVDPFKPQVDAAVDLEFGEVDQDFEKARRTSGQATRNVGDWWSGYQRDLARAQQTTAQGYQQAQQGVYNQANTARAQDQAQGSQMDAEAQKAAALRGTTAGPNVGAQAQASRQAQSNSFGGLVGAQGAAQNSYMADQGRIGGGIRALELGKEAGRGRVIEEEQRKSNVKKGAYRVAKRQELVDSLHKKRLEILTFEGREAAEAFDQANAIAGRKLQAKSQRQTAENQTATQRRLQAKDQRDMDKDAYQRKYGLGPYKRPASKKGKGGAKGGKDGPRSHKGYGKTNVSLPVAVTNRKDWEDLVADSKRVNRIPKKAKGLMRTVLKEYAGGRGKVSKKTALKVFRTYGFRLPYTKPGKVGKGIKRGNKKNPVKGF